MFLQLLDINSQTSVSEIVNRDYRTADVFRKYGISYCCGGKWPLQVACDMNGIDMGEIKKELQAATRNLQLPHQVNAADWDTDFLISYIINVHHQYLKLTLPVTRDLLREFAESHSKKFYYLEELESWFNQLANTLIHVGEEEETGFFPYIRQITHSHRQQEPYGALLVRTLRKPIEKAVSERQKETTEIISSIRQLTSQYQPPDKACVSHKVVFGRLKELDNDLMRHFFLEETVLFPRLRKIEQELLGG